LKTPADESPGNDSVPELTGSGEALEGHRVILDDELVACRESPVF
jgi:hypothetical protein